jgi:hypothetical protein
MALARLGNEVLMVQEQMTTGDVDDRRALRGPPVLAEVPCPREFVPADGADEVVVFDDVALMAI